MDWKPVGKIWGIPGRPQWICGNPIPANGMGLLPIQRQGAFFYGICLSYLPAFDPITDCPWILRSAPCGRVGLACCEEASLYILDFCWVCCPGWAIGGNACF